MRCSPMGRPGACAIRKGKKPSAWTTSRQRHSVTVTCAHNVSATAMPSTPDVEYCTLSMEGGER